MTRKERLLLCVLVGQLLLIVVAIIGRHLL